MSDAVDSPPPALPATPAAAQRSPWRVVGIVVTAGLVVAGVALAAFAGEGDPPPPTVEQSVSTVTASTIVDADVLRGVYLDSMRQLRECIDERRSDPATATRSFPC